MKVQENENTSSHVFINKEKIYKHFEYNGVQKYVSVVGIV